jgi:hypothetical protein
MRYAMTLLALGAASCYAYASVTVEEARAIVADTTGADLSGASTRTTTYKGHTDAWIRVPGHGDQETVYVVSLDSGTLIEWHATGDRTPAPGAHPTIGMPEAKSIAQATARTWLGPPADSMEWDVLLDAADEVRLRGSVNSSDDVPVEGVAGDCEVWIDMFTGQVVRYSQHAPLKGPPLRPKLGAQDALAAAEAAIGRTIQQSRQPTLVQRHGQLVWVVEGTVSGADPSQPDKSTHWLCAVDAISGEVLEQGPFASASQPTGERYAPTGATVSVAAVAAAVCLPLATAVVLRALIRRRPAL